VQLTENWGDIITLSRASDKDVLQHFELTANVSDYQKYRKAVNDNSTSSMR